MTSPDSDEEPEKAAGDTAQRGLCAVSPVLGGEGQPTGMISMALTLAFWMRRMKSMVIEPSVTLTLN